MHNIRSQSLSHDVLSSSGKTFVSQSFTIDWTLGELSILYLPIGTYYINFQIDKSVYSQTIKIQKTK